MWWVRPSIEAQNPLTPSATCARPMAGSALAKRNLTSGVRYATNLPASMASMAAKIGATSRLMIHSWALSWRGRSRGAACPTDARARPGRWPAAGPRVAERHQVVVNGVADPQPEPLGVEVRHPPGLGGEQQRVPEPARQHVL